MVSKERILSEIRRTAEENGGVALGRQRFKTAIGIKEHDWSGIHWARWSDALKEAGYAANQLNSAYDEAHLLDKFISLIQELGRYPVAAEIRLKDRRDQTFPSAKVFERLGTKKQLAIKVAARSRDRGLADVVGLCAAVIGTSANDVSPVEELAPNVDTAGFVYLLKSGRFFKIGRTNAAGRRERELAIQLPEKAALVHSIATDDPPGIEDYWHRRFAAKRANGEWFSPYAAGRVRVPPSQVHVR